MMATALVVAGALALTVMVAWIILVMIDAKDGEGGLPYDWWDDEEKE